MQSEKSGFEAPQTAGQILAKVKVMVEGDRNTTHGPKAPSFRVIAALWETYLNGKKTPRITPADVTNMMVLLKMARSIQGEPIEDHYLDMVGYAAISGELMEET